MVEAKCPNPLPLTEAPQGHRPLSETDNDNAIAPKKGTMRRDLPRHAVLCSTLTTAACDCGSPDKKLQFTAEGHFIGLESLSCDEWYGDVGAPGVVTSMAGGKNPVSTPDTMDGLFAGVAWLFKGEVMIIRTDYGAEEAKGVVEFIPSIGDVPENNTRIGVAPKRSTEGVTARGSSGRLLLAEAATNTLLEGFAAAKGEPVKAPTKEAPKPAEQPKSTPVDPTASKDAPKVAPANPAPAKETPKPAEQPKTAPAKPTPAKEAPKAAPAHPAPVDKAPQVGPMHPAPAKEVPQTAPAHPAPAKAAPAKPQQPTQHAPSTQNPTSTAPEQPQQPTHRAPAPLNPAAAPKQQQQLQARSALPSVSGAGKRQVPAGGTHKHVLGSLNPSYAEDGEPMVLPLVKGGSLKVVLYKREREY